MIPISKVREIISKHKQLEKELSSGEVKRDDFAHKSKEYSELNEIVDAAKEIEKFNDNRKDLG